MIYGGVRLDSSYHKWTLAYLSFFLLSVLWALNAKFAIYVIGVNLLPILIMIYATITYIKKNQDINAILFVIYLVAIIMLFFIVTHMEEFVIGARFGDTLNEEGEEEIWNSNGVGVNLCFALFSGFILFVNQKRHFIIRLCYFVSVVVMVVAILLTGSRKSLLILLMPITYFLYKKEKRHFVLLFFSAIIIGLLFYELVMNVEVFYEVMGTRIEDMIAILSDDTTGNEDTSRMKLIDFGLNKFLDNPILGVGINNFRVLSEQIYPGKNFYAHNNYVELLVDIGLVGIVIYYSAYYYLYLKLRKYSDTLSMWCKVFLFILLFLAFFEVLYYEPLEQLVFCLIFCIVELNKKKVLLLNGKRIENS